MFYAQLEAVLRGEQPVDSVSKTTLSFQIYNIAVKVLAAARYHRIQMMDDYPPQISALIQAEVIRIHGIRRSKPKPRPKVQPEPVSHKPDWQDWA